MSAVMLAPCMLARRCRHHAPPSLVRLLSLLPGKQNECGGQAAEAEEDLRVMSARARQAESRARDAQDELREMRLRAREAEHDARLAHDQVRELKEAKLSPALSVDSLSNAVCGGQGDNERLSRALDKVQVVLLLSVSVSCRM